MVMAIGHRGGNENAGDPPQAGETFPMTQPGYRKLGKRFIRTEGTLVKDDGAESGNSSGGLF